jgi:D-beta-D-heptose 7-phosphate kinase/D-beta-D-heptose 1-phosphate adenosyltransferase
MKEIIENFQDVSILVVGDMMIDHYIWGKVKRISPEAPVPVVEVMRENFRLGGAGNVINNIVSLGGKAFVTAVAGVDDMGKVLKTQLAEIGVSDSGIVYEKKRPTSLKSRVIAHNQQVVRIDRENTSDISPDTMGSIMKYIEDVLPEIQGIIISDYNKGVIRYDLLKWLIKRCASKYIAVDPKVGHFHYYHNVNLITPNINEASQGAGIEIRDMKTLKEAGRVLLNNLKCSSVLITRGEDGMSLFESDGTVTHIPTCAREVYDVTGAGDTVIATFVLALCAGASLKESASISNHAAGIVVGEIGAVAVKPEILIQRIKGDKKNETC